MIDPFTIRCRAIQLVDQLCRQIMAPEGVICAVKQMLGSHDLVAALQRFGVVADGVNVQLAEIVIDGMP